jgi:hypothetical protein
MLIIFIVAFLSICVAGRDLRNRSEEYFFYSQIELKRKESIINACRPENMEYDPLRGCYYITCVTYHAADLGGAYQNREIIK